MEVEPDVDDREEHTDAFGNRVLQFGVHHQHDALRVQATAEVVVEPMHLDGDGPPWESVAEDVRGVLAAARRCSCARSPAGCRSSSGPPTSPSCAAS